MCVGGDGFDEGLKEDDWIDDLEVDLAAVDDVLFAFAVGFEALEFGSIPVPTSLSLRD